MRVLCFLLAASATVAALPAGAADRALVVGVERYAHSDVPPTVGSERDARELAQFLQSRMGFSEGSIHLLLNAEATSARIEEEFRSWLIAGSAPGDRVFFSYSGHGSRLPRADGSGGFHNTLAPFDVDPETGRNQILDSTIRELVNRLAGRRAVLLFDSCHSGSIARSLPGSTRAAPSFSGRYLPTPAELAAFRASESRTLKGSSFIITEDTRALSKGSKSTSRGMFLTTSMMEATSGIIAIAAAADDQVAYPFQVEDGKVMGALTWAFLASVRQGTRPFGELRAEIPAEIARLQKAGRLQGLQVPQFDIRTTDTLSLEAQPLFGSWQTAAATALQNPASRARLSLRMAPKRPGEPYREGETFAFDVETSTAGNLYLLVFSEGRKASCLIPNAVDRNPRISAGRTRFPRKGEEFVIQCHPSPCGKDVAVAIVSERPLRLGEKENYTWDEVFDRLGMKELEAFLGTGSKRGRTSLGPAGPAGDWQAGVTIFESRKK